MSARKRWWITGLLPGIVILPAIPFYIDGGNWPAAILAATFVPLAAVNRIAQRHTYRAGWFAGRVSMHLDVHDIDPEPWQDLPPRAPVTRRSFPR